jgi:hypothetical protein
MRRKTPEAKNPKKMDEFRRKKQIIPTTINNVPIRIGDFILSSTYVKVIPQINKFS